MIDEEYFTKHKKVTTIYKDIKTESIYKSN